VIVESYELGPLGTNSYIIANERDKKAAVIDPADEGDALVTALESKGYELVTIINTHDHRDHTSGNYILKKSFKVPIQIHKDDAERLRLSNDSLINTWFKGEKSPPADVLLEDGSIIEVGDIKIKVIHTPGHTPGGACLLVEDEKILFSGDTLMAGGIGRTDFPGGNYDELMHSIKVKLFSLDDGIKIFPGHGGTSTIGNEKRYNIYLR